MPACGCSCLAVQLAKLRAEQQQLGDSVSTLEGELAGTQTQLERCEMEKTALSDKATALTQQVRRDLQKGVATR